MDTYNYTVGYCADWVFSCNDWFELPKPLPSKKKVLNFGIPFCVEVFARGLSANSASMIHLTRYGGCSSRRTTRRSGTLTPTLRGCTSPAPSRWQHCLCFCTARRASRSRSTTSTRRSPPTWTRAGQFTLPLPLHRADGRSTANPGRINTTGVTLQLRELRKII